MSGLLSQVLRLNHRTYDLWLCDVVTLKHEHFMYQNNRIRQMSVLFKTALLCYEQQQLTAATAYYHHYYYTVIFSDGRKATKWMATNFRLS